MGVAEGTGATITLSQTGVSILATSIQSQGISWAEIETTNLGTTGGAKTFIQGDLYDPGSINVNFNTEATDLDTLLVNSSSETVTITYPDQYGSTEVGNGFVTSLDPGTMEVDTLVTGSLTIKRTGKITFTDGTST